MKIWTLAGLVEARDYTPPPPKVDWIGVTLAYLYVGLLIAIFILGFIEGDRGG